MVITLTMKNVKLRNGIYEFRIAIPMDCRAVIGKREHSESLKTRDPAVAATLAKPLAAQWKQKFKNIRSGAQKEIPPVKTAVDNTVADFKQQLDDHLMQHLAVYLDRQTEEELVESSDWLLDSIFAIQKEDIGVRDLSSELGITYPLPAQKSPGIDRKFRQTVIDALIRIREAIDVEAGWAISDKVEKDILEPIPKSTKEDKKSALSSNPTEGDINEVMNLMFAAKSTATKYRGSIEGDVKWIQEWLNGKSDVREYTKADLIDYIINCLPYFPKHMSLKPEYNGKSLRECVALVKADSKKYIPISHRTCENRLAGLQTVFSYAKKDLGLIQLDPATGITIPVVRSGGTKERGFTDNELTKLWNELELIAKAVEKRPERYWVTVLALYHGLRQNEICSLRLGDVYIHDDGTYVIDVNLDGPNKSVKNKSSIRIVPVHPYVLNTLGFRKYVDIKKAKNSHDELLFPNLTYTESQGYARKISNWFNGWKKSWLSPDAHHKNFHSLRHTFSQQAQNQAKIPDRYSQEITGHSTPGISEVHLNYSGKLKPKDLLVELSKLKYGWE